MPDVQVTLDNKGLFATGYKVVNDKDFIPKKKIYTLKLRYTGDRYYDENGVTTEVKGNWIVDDYKIADPKLKNLNDVHYGYEYPKSGSEYDTSNSNYDSTLALPSSKEIVFSIRSENPDLDETHLRELVNKKINLNQIVFPVVDGKYFFTPYRIYYSTEKDENGEISYKCNEETSDPVGESSVSYLGAKADSAFKKYGVYADMSNGSESGMYIGYPHVPRPIDSKNLSINLGLTIYYYEMPKVIAIGEDGKKIQSLPSLDPRGVFGYPYEREYATVEDLNNASPTTIPNTLEDEGAAALVNLSNWYDKGYHLADLGNVNDMLTLPNPPDKSNNSAYAKGLKEFAKINGFTYNGVNSYGGTNGGCNRITKDKKGILFSTYYSSYGLIKTTDDDGRYVTASGATGPIFIVMSPDDQKNTIIVRDSKTGKDLETVSIRGKTDQTVPVNLTFPEHYVLHDGYKWITDYTFKADSEKPVIILVDPYEHKKDDPLIGDKPTFPLPKPEKKPDDKPKTPDKPKVPDEITVPDITDVPEPTPAVITPDQPKELKGENIDDTLTTPVKGQNVTKPKHNNPVKPMAEDVKTHGQEKQQPVVQKVAYVDQKTPKATLPQTGERNTVLLSLLGGLVALTGLIYLGKDRKNRKA